ncbi:glycosyltransferase [Glycomyces arizonensis]|uniref:glycosyltransferase n=1 Tax=Glycomyces arizonensis TaxID=256035 RepID=UPI001B7FA637|nr:glycosyltransferase [Glycomyces arizonensis]
MTDRRARRVAVVTPWYPTSEVPYRGSFVRAMVEAVAPGCDAVTVYHLELWAVRLRAERLAPIWEAQRRLLPRSVPPVATAGGATLYRVPAMVPPTESWADRSDEAARWFRTALGGEAIDAPVVHAHVPLLAGHAALENCGPGAAVYATEHSSFLADVLAQGDARRRYDEILHRLAGYFVVGEPLRALVAATFPHHADKIGHIANPVDFGSRRPRPPAGLRRWLSIAGLVERKRIDYLLRGFARCLADDPALTLTLAGDGALRAELEALSAELGIEEAVDFLGAVEPADIPGLMAEHDLLVHTSRHETFGVVVVEAAAAGLPVLVTRCGGPEQVLRGVEFEAGQLIDVDDDPDVLVKGFAELRGRHPGGLDLEAARARLRRRYSHAAVADQHYRAWGWTAEEGER